MIGPDRKSTRLNSSHLGISYAVFCLKKTTCLQAKAWQDEGLSAVNVAVNVSAIQFLFFFNDTATTEIYTLSLHDALLIFSQFFFNFYDSHVLSYSTRSKLQP